MTIDPLNDRIREFYDRSSALWLNTWGEHMHHGYYGPDGREKKNHQQAQIDLIEALIQWAGIQQPKRILDVGCGVGGSARFLANRFQAEVLGLTLSPVQVHQALNLTNRAGLDQRVRFKVQDVFRLKPTDGPFDLIWSLESAEHMADKPGLLSLFHELLAPGGQFVMATWCHRQTPPELAPWERALLEDLYRSYHLSPMISISKYRQLAAFAGFKSIETADWSHSVAPFWKAVIRSVFRWSSIEGLLQSGWSTLRGAWAMRYMNSGYRRGIIKFGLIQGRKL